jgi:hypothetical protein
MFLKVTGRGRKESSSTLWTWRWNLCWNMSQILYMLQGWTFYMLSTICLPLGYQNVHHIAVQWVAAGIILRSSGWQPERAYPKYAFSWFSTVNVFNQSARAASSRLPWGSEHWIKWRLRYRQPNFSSGVTKTSLWNLCNDAVGRSLEWINLPVHPVTRGTNSSVKYVLFRCRRKSYRLPSESKHEVKWVRRCLVTASHKLVLYVSGDSNWSKR